MNVSLDKNIRRNSIGIALLIVTVIFGILILIPAYALKAIFAIIAFTIAIVLPIRQKQFPFSSLVFMGVGILFILSGAIGGAAENFTNSLSVSSQIEFSKILRPWQVSTGLSHVGFGIYSAMLAWIWSTSLKNKPSSSKVISRSPLIFYIFAFLYIILGVSTILRGLSRL